MGVSISSAKVRENGRIEARWIILGFHTLFFGQVKPGFHIVVSVVSVVSVVRKKIHRTHRIHSISYNNLYLSFLLY